MYTKLCSKLRIMLSDCIAFVLKYFPVDLLKCTNI